VTADGHRDGLGNSGTDHVAHSRAAEVVEMALHPAARQAAFQAMSIRMTCLPPLWWNTSVAILLRAETSRFLVSGTEVFFLTSG